LVPNLLVLSEQFGFASARATALQMVAIGVGGLVLPVTISQLFEPIGPHVVTWTLLVGSLLALAGFTLSLTAEAVRT
jgi:hypothetical protein